MVPWLPEAIVMLPLHGIAVPAAGALPTEGNIGAVIAATVGRRAKMLLLAKGSVVAEAPGKIWPVVGAVAMVAPLVALMEVTA